MEQKELHEREKKCVQEQPPECTAACPLHVDVRGIAAAIRQKDYQAGLSLLHQRIPFPRIISRICDQPCQQTCVRKNIDEAISIGALERFLIDNCNEFVFKRRPVQPKDKTVAIIGGGLSGLSAAVELGKKGYKIIVFETANHLGGSIQENPESRLPRQLMEDDFAQLKHFQIEIRFNTKVGNGAASGGVFDQLCTSADAVFLGIGCTGRFPLEFGLAVDKEGRLIVDPLTLETSNSKVFAGGSLVLGAGRRSPITSISHGKIAANSIDRLLSKVSLTASRENEGPVTTSLYTNIAGVTSQAAVKSDNPEGGYSGEEALREANRCLLCECMECVKVCEYLADFRSYPKRYVREIYNNLSIVMGVHHANKMINSCSLCGLCEQVCPSKLNMGEICLEARRTMVKKGKMPPSAHDFALRDMQFSTGKDFVLGKHQSGFLSSSVIFFPGCQLSASSPQHVKKMYEFLCGKISGGVGLMLGCCGAPADWAGQEELCKSTMKNIENRWRELGAPKVITGCSTCYSLFKRELPHMSVEPLWIVLDNIGLPNKEYNEKFIPLKVAIHDTCTTRYETRLQQSVRNIVRKMGHEIEELHQSNETTECCGYGGLMSFANQEIAHKAADRRINESKADYLTYCAMCRDNFASRGKRAYHLLDLLFGNEEQDMAERKGPGYSERHENRARLKESLLKEVWGETMDKEECSVSLIINEKVKQIIEERMILYEDIAKVIAYAESTGNKLKSVERATFIAYFKPVSVTYWVEYSSQEDGFVVHNAYSHRLEIKG